MSMFPYTLWHGTSAHLLPTIKEHGLGGRNVMEDWRVMEFLRSALASIDVVKQDFTPQDEMGLMSIRAAVRGGADGMNFEYGDVYVAGGLQRAADYALTAPEQISFVSTLLTIADRHGLTSIKNGLNDFPEIADFLSRDVKPIVLKLPPIPMVSVMLEDGRAVPSFILERDYETLKPTLSQLGFRLTSTISFDEIEVIDVSDHTHSFPF